jgi:hypothetical protein
MSMRGRSREVNIFNMSLLDILCGALRAFCFLMLTLFPDHIRAKQLEQQMAEMKDSADDPERVEEAERKQQEAEDRAREAEKRAEEAEKKAERAKDRQSLVYLSVTWRDDVDVDIWALMPDGKWVLPKKDVVPKDRLYGETFDHKKGPAREQVWQVDVAGYEKPLRFRLFAKWQAGTKSPTGPVFVNGYIAARAPLQGESNSMVVDDLGIAAIMKPGDRIELGSVSFKGNDYTITRGPSSDPPEQGR